MILGMTGTRAGASTKALERFEEFLRLNEITHGHHGGAVGADTQFHEMMRRHGIPVTVHYPREEVSKEFLRRNREIVEASEVMIAFPNILSTDPEPLRSGTYATIRYARKCRKPLLIFYPDGSVVSENC